MLSVPDDGSFDSRVVLLDPYAQTIAPITLPESAGEGSGNISNTMEDFDGYLGCLSSLVEPGFTWESTSASRLPLEESVIYKLDLCKVISSSGPLLHVKGEHVHLHPVPIGTEPMSVHSKPFQS